jgi:hypothetical protein
MRFDFLQAVTDAHAAQDAKMSALLQEGFRLEGARDDRKKDREKKEQENGQDTLTVMLLSELDDIEAVELQAQIARHDQAIIEALIENEERLAAADRRVEKLLGEAHVLPDGRRVFKTEDGLRVFDEFGQEVGADDVAPTSIDEARPRWETFHADKGVRDGLIEERRDLLEYQGKLDEMQDRMANGTMSQSDLDQLHSLMADDVPESVRRHLPPNDPAALGNAPQFSGWHQSLITDTNTFDFN